VKLDGREREAGWTWTWSWMDVNVKLDGREAGRTRSRMDVKPDRRAAGWTWRC